MRALLEQMLLLTTSNATCCKVMHKLHGTAPYFVDEPCFVALPCRADETSLCLDAGG